MLWALLTVFQKVLSKLLESQCQIELNSKNQTTLTYSLLYHVLSNNSVAKNRMQNNKGNKHLLIDHKGGLLTSIDLFYFDITLLVDLIKNVNSTQCFKRFNGPVCNTPSCSSCKVKVAVEEIRKLRNVSAHQTDPQLVEFLNGTRNIHDFSRLRTFEEMGQYFDKQLQSLLEYLRDGTKFPLSTVSGTYLFS